MTSTIITSSSWLQMELRLLLQNEISRRIEDKEIDSNGALAVALRIPEAEAQVLRSTEVWALDVQLGALERLAELGENIVSAGEFVTSLWLAAKFTDEQRKHPDGAFWQVGGEEISVIMRNDDFGTQPEGWVPAFPGYLDPAQDEWDEPGTKSTDKPFDYNNDCHIRPTGTERLLTSRSETEVPPPPPWVNK